MVKKNKTLFTCEIIIWTIRKLPLSHAVLPASGPRSYSVRKTILVLGY